MIVIVYGKEASDKTRRAKELLAYYNCIRLVDNWDGKTTLRGKDLALTNLSPPYKNVAVPCIVVDIETAKRKITER